jgi:hypothetical protein
MQRDASRLPGHTKKRQRKITNGAHPTPQCRSGCAACRGSCLLRPLLARAAAALPATADGPVVHRMLAVVYKHRNTESLTAGPTAGSWRLRRQRRRLHQLQLVLLLPPAGSLLLAVLQPPVCEARARQGSTSGASACSCERWWHAEDHKPQATSFHGPAHLCVASWQPWQPQNRARFAAGAVHAPPSCPVHATGGDGARAADIAGCRLRGVSVWWLEGLSSQAASSSGAACLMASVQCMWPAARACVDSSSTNAARWGDRLARVRRPLWLNMRARSHAWMLYTKHSPRAGALGGSCCLQPTPLVCHRSQPAWRKHRRPIPSPRAASRRLLYKVRHAPFNGT